MGRHTKIQWCDSTVNGSTGCDGCELWKLVPALSTDHRPKMGGTCYAGVFHENRLAKSLPRLYASDFTEVRLAPGRIAAAANWSDLTGQSRADKPWLDGWPRTIFVGDMGDFLSEAVTFEYLRAELIDNVVSDRGRRHIWMLLTKRPHRLAMMARVLREQGLDWPRNLWTGTSITNRASLRRINPLRTISATRFLSMEPLIADPGRIDLTGISLVIVGGESGPDARPFDLQWARSVRDQCRVAGVPFFLKQYGAVPVDAGRRIDLSDPHGGDPREWPEAFAREFPNRMD